MKKKLLHIQLLPLLSGAQNVMLHLLSGLDAEEFEIWVACRPDGSLADEVKQRGWHFLPLPLLVRPISPLDAVVLIQLIHIFRRRRFDIVHTHSSKPGLLGRLAASMARVPLIIHTAHGAPFYEGQPAALQKFYMLLEKLGASLGHWLVFVNHYHRDLYLQHKLVNPNRAVTIYNALEPELQARLEVLARPPARRGDIVVIGSVLRFSRQKNIVMTFLAAIRVCLARQDVNFIFVGDGEQFDLCRQLVQTHDLQDRILLPGWQRDTVEWLARFDVFLLYSDYEGLPMSVIEAMLAGLPVIGSDIPTIAELVDGHTGWLIPAGQPERLEKDLHKILDNRGSFSQKGQAGRQKARELCSYENFRQGYLALYKGD